MARRQRQPEEHVNHERWLVSYADFITLLFAFFVVMYSVSSVNEGKYRVLSNTLEGAFKGEKKTLDPIQIGDVIQSQAIIERLMRLESDGDKPIPDLFSDSTPQVASKIVDTELDDAQEVKESQVLEQLQENLSLALSSFIDKDLVSVKKNDLWVEVEMKSSLLFNSGSATLSNKALRVLWKVAKPIRKLNNHIQVEGFTDNIPISSFEYPSNWELSAGRAASVVHLFSKYGIDPNRLAAVGYGEYHPLEENSTAEGRDANRRVVVVIQSNAISRFAGAKQKKLDPKVVSAASELREALGEGAVRVNQIKPLSGKISGDEQKLNITTNKSSNSRFNKFLNR